MFMPLTIRRLCWPLFVASALLWILSSEALAEPRVEIALFKYLGASEGEAKKKFEQFRWVMRNKILNLKVAVLQKTSEDDQVDVENLGYLDSVYINFKGEDTFEGERPERINELMKNERAILGLLRETIISDDNTNYTVYSEFYLRDLKGFYPRDVITVRLPVKSTEFGNTRDSHTLVILYALAMDAKRLGYDKNHIALFLKVAKDEIAKIKNRTSSFSAELAGLERAINQAETELLGGLRQ